MGIEIKLIWRESNWGRYIMSVQEAKLFCATHKPVLIGSLTNHYIYGNWSCKVMGKDLA